MNRNYLLIDFYINDKANDRGFTLAQLLSKSDEWFERNHMFIQWLFPLKTESSANIYAPLLDDQIINALHGSQIAQDNLVRSFVRFCSVLGLSIDKAANREQNIGVSKSPKFEQRRHYWFTNDTHNNARITRVLTSLTLLGRDDLARALYKGIIHMVESESDCGISEYALQRWHKAM